MSKKTDNVKSGYAELSESERKEVVKFITEFESASFDRKRSLKESYRSALNKSLGPISDASCPCCGR